jgi:hypothetical protein
MAEEEAEVQSKPEWHGLCKSKVLTGTFDEDAFQLQVECTAAEANAGSAEDTKSQLASTTTPILRERLESREPLTVPLFDGLGYHCAPHCGVYAQDDYEPALPFVFVSLPYELLQRCTLDRASGLLPHKLREELTGPASPWFATSSSSFYVMVHPIPLMKECQHFMCDSRREINVISHTWTLPDVQFTRELEVPGCNKRTHTHTQSLSLSLQVAHDQAPNVCVSVRTRRWRRTWTWGCLERRAWRKRT